MLSVRIINLLAAGPPPPVRSPGTDYNGTYHFTHDPVHWIAVMFAVLALAAWVEWFGSTTKKNEDDDPAQL